MANGSWDSITNYTDCSKDIRQDYAHISLVIYAAGEFSYQVYSHNSNISPSRICPLLPGSLPLTSCLPLIQVNYH